LLPRETVNLKKEMHILSIGMHMTSESGLMEKLKGIIEKRGRVALEQAKQEILDSPYDGGVVSSALKYFARVTLKGGLPVFPALISLSCEAVGGKTEKTTSIGAALTLIAGVADIHDDIIDQSAIKYSKKTVFGKFGGDIALLAGDALLIQGVMFLHRECESLPKRQRKTILSLITSAFFEISNAEAKETRLMRRLDITPQEYFEMISLKAVVHEVHCKIGGILGNGDMELVEALGNYGRVFGIVSGIRDDFIDLFEYPELENRLKNECLPLPMLCALQNSEIKKEFTKFLGKQNLTEKQVQRFASISLKSAEVEKLKTEMNRMIQKAIDELPPIKNPSIEKELRVLLKVTIDDL
jgi:geranylgeranyl pyrophosphate synthase